MHFEQRTAGKAQWENERSEVPATVQMAVELGGIVRSHLSTMQAIANAKACMATKDAERGMNENYHKVRKLFTNRAAQVLIDERRRVAEENESFDKVRCPQCDKLHPRPKQQPDPTN